MRYMMLLSGISPSTPPPPELFEAILQAVILDPANYR
jgi:hypothetical protein